MRKGDLVKLVCDHSNLGAPWPRGGPGVWTCAAPSKQRWFPDGTCGVLLGKTYPRASKKNNFALSMREVLIGDEVHTVTVKNL